MPYTAPYQWRNPYPAPCHIDIPPFDLYNDDSLRAEIRLIQRWLSTRGVYLSEYGNENAADALPEVPVDTFMQRLDADQVSFDLITEVRGAIPLIALLREFGVHGPHGSYSLKHKLEKFMSAQYCSNGACVIAVLLAGGSVMVSNDVNLRLRF